jgi:hypothetical protein
MTRYSRLAIGLVVLASACSKDSPSAPTVAAVPTFSFGLSANNEVPPFANAESAATGTVTIKLNITRDAANNITATTVDFAVTLAGFSQTSVITAAHIHEAVAGVVGSVRVNTGLASGEVILAGGNGAFTKNGVNVADLAIVQRILANPSAFYFNVHSTVNPSGVVRGQLVRTD